MKFSFKNIGYSDFSGCFKTAKWSSFRLNHFFTDLSTPLNCEGIINGEEFSENEAYQQKLKSYLQG